MIISAMFCASLYSLSPFLISSNGLNFTDETDVGSNRKTWENFFLKPDVISQFSLLMS
ncbi:secreted protein [methanotrophic bacterial endosymbiont of Bathymodiolus sp.]|nr:secreted protein [methanotrophic bacterial endosymbiont of Bathymodiolus sp.]